MSGLKRLKHLDYAVYGNLIVPLLMFDACVMIELYDDSDAGRCRIICRPRKRK
ncbi:hypothetical protein KP806_07690 [Paenibacillus sp. N4]|uniref:hypothetical protein n=1 Tax=Paenibacillus vietnamensis TaxID=2590547 RepID=UPI001CD0C376|nr:hypothetical protein [Paenibacillus vietnamensis]MCA0754929.1 hypothetical protein [Paenibacillus vietnamensis]